MRPSKPTPFNSIIFSRRVVSIALLLLAINSTFITARKSTSDPSNKSTINDQDDITIRTGDKECNTDLLTLFGVSGEKRVKDEKATSYEKAFCRRNKRSCCSSFNIESTNMSFSKGAKALREKFEVIEELFSLFRGPLFLEYVAEHKGKDVCHEDVKDMQIELEGQNYGFFDHAYQRYQLMMIENLLMDITIYIKKNLWFYGDLICMACNPDLQDHFKLSKDGSVIEVHTNTCSEMLEEREFERNLLLVFNNYIFKAMKFIECVEDIKIKEEDPEAESEEDEEAFINIDQAQTEEFLTTFEDCWDDQNVEQSQCVDFCTKNLRLYVFPINHLMHNYKLSLKIMYKAMTGNDIEDYYSTIKDMQWTLEHENDPIAFYPANEIFNEYKFDELKWEYHSSKGQNIYKELMSKKYLDFEGVAFKGIAIFAALISIFMV